MIDSKKRDRETRTILIWGYLIAYWVTQAIFITYDIAYNVMIIISVVVMCINIAGCYYWLKYKGRSIWFLPLSLIGLFGWIVLAMLKDKNIQEDNNGDI